MWHRQDEGSPSVGAALGQRAGWGSVAAHCPGDFAVAGASVLSPNLSLCPRARAHVATPCCGPCAGTHIPVSPCSLLPGWASWILGVPVERAEVVSWKAERLPTCVRSKLSDFVEETQGPKGQLRVGTEGSSQGRWRLKQGRQREDLEAPPAWGGARRLPPT